MFSKLGGFKVGAQTHESNIVIILGYIYTFILYVRQYYNVLEC